MTQIHRMMFILYALSLLTISACGSSADQTSGSPSSDVESDPTADAINNSVQALFEQTASAVGDATSTTRIEPPSPMPTLDPAQDPAATTRLWVNGFLEGDGIAIRRYTCTEDVSDVSLAATFSNIFIGMGEAALAENVPGDMEITYDIDDLAYVVIEQSQSTARVSVEGEAFIGIGPFAEGGESDAVFDLIYEDSRWKVCGF